MSAPGSDEFAEERAAQEAAAWVLRCDRGLSAAEQDAFSQWLAADPRHGAQLARHRRHWQRLDLLADWRPEHSARPNPDLLAPPRRGWLRFWPAAAGLAAAAAVAFFFLAVGEPRDVGGEPVPRVAATFAAAEAEVVRRVLDDGTVVELNRGAALHVRFSSGERRVTLERGEAHFTVTHDAARPFIVTAHGMDVRAVGTAFNVRLEGGAVEVLVTEGRVRVDEAARALSPAVARPELGRTALVPQLEAGQRAVVSLAPAASPRIAVLTPGEIERVLAWQHRLIEFTSAPLAEVVAEFNRRNAVQIVVLDPDLAAVRLSASFRSDNIEGFVRLLEAGFGAQTERRATGEIVLRKAR
jgi:transmembrane sensor